MKTTATSGNDFFLSKISTRKLFGHFDYDLDFTTQTEAANRLVVLYGDNGSGKTTLLKMVFHLLSPIDDCGHKSVLAAIKFQLFEVCLADGTIISARRETGTIDEAIHLKVQKKNQIATEVTLKVEGDGKIKMQNTPDQVHVKRFLGALKQLNLEVLFMRDDRRLTSNLDEKRRADGGEEFNPNQVWDELPPHRMMHLHLQPPQSKLSATVETVNQYFRRHALTATSRGEIDTNKIYDAIIKQLVLPRRASTPPSQDEIVAYLSKMEAVANRNRDFVKVGLTSPLMAENMLKTLRRAKPSAWPALLNVLRPYIDSVEARLAALEPIRKITDQFIESINSFIGTGKTVSFNLERGLQIQGYDGDILEPDSLSSGEKQLLTLFCHIICVRDKSAVFMIDEPELSLNVKWQRRLVQSLLDCTAGASIQFVMASHSMELLARHRDHVVALRNIAK